MPSLILLTEDSPRQIFQLGRATLMIGRDDTSEIRVLHDSVSRNHASIIVEGNDFVVRDNGSTNGTYVNGQSINRQVLRHHDIIRFGSCLFMVDMKDVHKGPRGTDVITITHSASKDGKIVEITPRSLIQGSPIEPIRMILSSSKGNIRKKRSKKIPPLTAR